MPYSSSLTDSEWGILEPLLIEILPQKKQTRPSNWTKRDIINGIFASTEERLQLGRLTIHTCRLTPRSTGTCIQWREAGAVKRLMQALHGQVRQQVKKKPHGQR